MYCDVEGARDGWCAFCTMSGDVNAAARCDHGSIVLSWVIGAVEASMRGIAGLKVGLRNLSMVEVGLRLGPTIEIGALWTICSLV